MALQGTLDSFSLPDVLRLLADTGKTGRLHVEGDRGQGNVWIDDGAVVAVSAERALDDAPTDEVIFEMLRFNSGSFAFAADEPSPNGGEPVDLEGVLRRAGELLDEWRALEAVVPSLDHRVTIAPELTVDKVTIDASRWTTLVAVAGGVSVGELGSALGQNEMAILRTVSDLVELGIVVVQEPAKGQTSRRSRVGQPSSRRGRSDRVPKEERRPETQAEPHAAGTNGRSNGTNGNEDPVGSRPRRSLRDRPSPDLPAADRPDRPQPSQRPIGTTRSGVQRSSRQVGSSAAPGPAMPALPPSSPFSTGSVMPPQQGMPDPVVGQGLSGLPAFNNNETQPLMPGSLNSGPLGPSPLAPASAPVRQDTGQVPVVAASSLPPDLSWAAEDDETPLGPSPGPSSRPSPPMGTPPAPVGRSGSPLLASGQSPLGPEGPPPVADGDTAPHVAVMSPDARMAVEATVGRAGGGPGVVPAAGATPEEVQQRGALLGFLSSVRH